MLETVSAGSGTTVSYIRHGTLREPCSNRTEKANGKFRRMKNYYSFLYGRRVDTRSAGMFFGRLAVKGYPDKEKCNHKKSVCNGCLNSKRL